MINAVIGVKWKELRGQIRKWQDKRSDDQLSKVHSQREQFVGIPQKRYGYTQEKAVSELNRHYSKARLG
jgi:uncharacterized protein YjbJ (UPF0337 family)